jgi:peptidyl-prolyl cis-trans isomerase C
MKKHIIGGALASLLALPALAQNIAIVNGKAIPTSRADALKKQVEASGQAVTPEIMAKIKDELITREIFMQEAKKRALDATDEYKNQLELARQSILIRTLLADVQKKSAVSDAEIQAEYDKFVKENAGQEIRSRHILVETEVQAKDLIAQISKGAKFEDLAKKYSKDPGSGANGGDLDWANPAGFVPEFSAAMVKLGKGQMTDAPVKSQFGWHIIRVEDIRETQLPKLDEVKAQITQQLQQKKLAKFQDDLRAKAKIQ